MKKELNVRNMVFVAAAIALGIISGCGGGGSGPGVGGGTLNIASGQYFEFLRGNGSWFDPFNLVVGDGGTVVLAHYDSLGNRTALVCNGWATTSGGLVAISQTSSTTASFAVNFAPAGEFKFQVTSTVFGFFEQRARVPSAVATVSGRVVDLSIFSGQPTNNGIPHLDIDLFDNLGNVIGSARTMQDGRFTARVPTNAIEIMIEESTIKLPRYYKSVKYNNATYNPLDDGCRIPLGALGGGANPMPFSMGLPLEAGGPPPPPGGC